MRIGQRTTGSALLTLKDGAAERMHCKPSLCKQHNANSLSNRMHRSLAIEVSAGKQAYVCLCGA